MNATATSVLDNATTAAKAKVTADIQDQIRTTGEGIPRATLQVATRAYFAALDLGYSAITAANARRMVVEIGCEIASMDRVQRYVAEQRAMYQRQLAPAL